MDFNIKAYNDSFLPLIQEVLMNAIVSTDASVVKLNIAIYTHIDADGKTAGDIAKHIVENEVKTIKNKLQTNIDVNLDIRICYIDYKEGIPEIFGTDATTVPIVFFTDYSFGSIEKINRVRSIYPGAIILWIDHHITSFDLIRKNAKYFESQPAIRFYMAQRICGALLLYNLCYRNKSKDLSDIIDYSTYMILDYMTMRISDFKTVDNSIIQELKRVYPKLMDDVSMKWILYISDYDCWNKMLRKSNIFKAAYEARNCPTVLFLNPFANHEYLTEITVQEGEIISASFDQYFKDKYQPYMYEAAIITPVTKQEYTMAVMNVNDNSISFGDAINKYEICCAWHYQDGEYKYSIYSINPNINCKEIAEEYGGGGHPGAAGFRSSELLFK